MNKYQALLILTFFLSLWPSRALTQPCDSLDTVRWILGKWLAQDDNTFTYETWRQISPRTFEGMGEVTRKATMEKQSMETLRLVEMSGEIFYLAKVGHNALPIAFKLVHCADEVVIFENPLHDFPKRLE